MDPHRMDSERVRHFGVGAIMDDLVHLFWFSHKLLSDVRWGEKVGLVPRNYARGLLPEFVSESLLLFHIKIRFQLLFVNGWCTWGELRQVRLHVGSKQIGFCLFPYL